MSNTLKLGNGKWATGKDTLLSFSDTNNNYKPLPFSFSRASSGTVINKDGLIETVGTGEPRIDFKDNTKGSLLLEPTRSNLAENSENFGTWTIGNLLLTANAVISPEGLYNASKVTFNSLNHFLLYADIPVSSNTQYTFSFYVKRGTATNLKYRLRDASNSVDIIAPTSYYSQTSESEWKRIEVTFTTPLNCTSLTMYAFSDGQSLGTAYVWGAQLEAGSYATSYIPTSGSAVTRVADSSSQTVPDGVIGQTEGTVFLDFKPQTLDGTSRYLSIENSNSVGSGWMGVFASLVSGTIRFRFYGDGWDIDSSLIIEKDTRYKIAFSYKNGVQTSIYVNGNLLNNITASLSGKSYQKIRLSEAAIGVRGDADFKDIKLYDARLTDQELIALTS